MKSIKEISHDIGWNSTKVPMLYDRDACRQEWCEIAAMSGANYVLRQIENSLQEFSNYEDSLIISRIIEQLKR